MSNWASKWIILFTICYKNYIFTNGLIIEDLGSMWSFEMDAQFYPAVVPGGIYSDLMRIRKIGDVFHGFNDVNTRWVSKRDWNYSRLFIVSEDLLTHDNINLVFNGVDTFSEILINDVEVGTTENMFVRYIFNIKEVLKLGDTNEIHVQLKSPVNIAKKTFNEQAMDYEVVPLCVPDEYNGECHVNHIRKMQASFSWDWGPALPSVGIWKNVYIEAYNSTVLRDVTVNTVNNSEYWDVEFHIYLADTVNDNPIKGLIRILLQTDEQTETIVDDKLDVEKNENGDYLKIMNMKIEKSAVKLWWPNGYGEPNLYNVTVYYTNEEKTEQSEKTFRIGFRTAELVQDKIDSGRKFYFKVNDVPIYAKGSNSIPINVLPELGKDESTIRFLLQSAKDVHMNMLRVWGGGTYEVDIFYDLADEMGILIWQDFMFACSMYPATSKFLSNVKNEVRHQVRRLQHHPSIILWAGNNENEAALRQNWYGTGSNFTLFKADYKKLYVDTIQEELSLSDDTRPYLTSSPTNGIKSIEEDYVAEEPQSNFYGDVHFYNYNSDSWNPKTYPINRFASEYGYQSLPSINTLLTATDNIQDLVIGSEFLEHREHLPGGYDKMNLLINHRLRLPSKQIEDYNKTYIYYSQIIQAMAVKIETEYNRQWRSIIGEDGRGYTMGALYWQLNDVWVAPTWSGIDFKNNWKMMHYYAKHFFAPVIVTGDLSPDGTLDIYIVSDLMKPVPKAILTIYVYKWDSFLPIHNSTIKTSIPHGTSFKVEKFAVNTYFSAIEGKPCGISATENCFLYFTLTDDKNETLAPDNYVFPAPLKSTSIQIADVRIINITKNAETPYFTITVKADAIALFVWLEAKGIRGRFSDNGFQQITPLKNIYFTPENHEVKLIELKNSLSVQYLIVYKEENVQERDNSIMNQFSSYFITLFSGLLHSIFR